MEPKNDRGDQESYIRALFSRVIDGTPSDDELDELLSCLRDSEAVREAWREAISLHAELGLLLNSPRPFSAEELLLIDERRSLASFDVPEASVAVSGTVSPIGRPIVARRWLLVAIPCAAAAVVALAFMPTWLGDLNRVNKGDEAARLEMPPKPIASIIRSVGSDLGEGVRATDGLSLGEVVEFSRGLLEMEINQGVKVVVYAPARLRIEAEDAVSLDFGRVSVEVGVGFEGFRVLTGQAVVTDLGTSFSVDAEINGPSTVSVHSGEVDVRSRHDGGTTKRVLEGHRVRVGEAFLEPQPEVSSRPSKAPLVSLSNPHEAIPCQQDTYIVGGTFSNMIAGRSHLLLVKLDIQDPSFCRHAWIDFDVSHIPRKSLLAARLVMNVEPNDLADIKEPGNSKSDCNWMFAVSGMWNDQLPTWDESNTTWNNAPGHNGADFQYSKMGPAAPQSLGQFTIHGRGVHGEQVSIDTPDLADFIRADRDGRITLIVTRKTGYTWSSDSEDRVIHSFASRENPTLPPPTLELWFD